MKTASFLLATSMVVLLAACGKQESPPPAAPAAPAAPSAPSVSSAPSAPSVSSAPAPAPAPATADSAVGKSVYGKSCALCHAAGVAGAPKPGNKDDWAARIAQGTETLYKHAIGGFTGSKGMMPPRGGASSLSDAEVKAAVDYMVSQSQ